MKICFCFLTYYGLERVDIWNKFFKDIDTNLYKVYIHPKYSSFPIDKYLFPINIVQNRIETTAKTFLFGNYAAPTLNAGQNWPIGFSLTVDMTAGDTAKIIANVGNWTKSVAVFGDTATPRTGFSGFLVC